MRKLLGRAGSRLAGAISDHPFRTAGGVAALVAAVVMALGVQGRAQTAAGTTTADGTSVTTTAAIEFALAHPAYPITVVLGLAVLLLAR